MKPSLKGGLLPESLEDYEHLDKTGGLRFNLCRECKQPFSPANVQTRLGWAETQISGWCENCFDAMFSEDTKEKLP